MPLSAHTVPDGAPASDKASQPGQVFFRVLPAILTLAGLLLVLYVAAQYGWMYIEQQRFSRELQMHAPATQAGAPSAPITRGAALARLVIPKIKLDVAVVEGVSRKALLVGPGHLLNTPLPGDKGNAVLAGHRDTFFRHLGELSRGDIINIARDGRDYRYDVTGTEIVDPSDTEVLTNSPDYRLTLITCYPFYYLGPAPKRFIVFAQMNESANHYASAASGRPFPAHPELSSQRQ
jgi:LPXTG-site transpeptidase (sortase) family protein